MYHHRATRSVCLSLLAALAMFLLPLHALAATSAPTAVEISPDEHCPVCGMSPAAFPKWQSQVQFADGLHASFECPRDMLLFLNNMAQYDPKHDRQDVTDILVRDYASGAWIDATKSHFVAGSAVKGPMGEDFVPFLQIETARQFIAAKSGQFFALRQIDNDVLKAFIPASQFGKKM